MTTILIVAAFVTSMISAIIGMGGGIMLISIMSIAFPPNILIPIHGIIQLGSNLNRSIVYTKYINWKLTIPFMFGSILGGLLGSQILVQIPLRPYYIVLGTFILALTWLPKFNIPQFRGKFFLLGSSASFLSLFVGATGPYLAPFFLREKLDRFSLIATKASCQVSIHTAKIFVFFLAGFSIGPYIFIIGSMLTAGLLGTIAGKYLLGKVNEEIFRKIFKIVISFLALRLLYKGIAF